MRIERKSFARSDGGETEVIRDLAFELPQGALTCMLGPSGCGKTTTLRILLGLDRDFRGSLPAALREARPAAVFQEPRLLPWRSVEQNVRLALPPELAGKDVAPLLDAVELGPFRHAFPAELSLGMARRAALARAFAVEPEFLLLDEPFVSLDEPTAERLRDLLLRLWDARPTTVLMVTHNLREAVRLADRLLILSQRPARLLGAVDLAAPRAGRHGAALEEHVTELARRFPQLAHGP